MIDNDGTADVEIDAFPLTENDSVELIRVTLVCIVALTIAVDEGVAEVVNGDV